MEIYAEVIFYSTQRTTLPRKDYRPDALFGDNKDYWGITFLNLPIENFDVWTPARIKFTLQKSNYFEIVPKQKFYIMEGSRQVGEGKVISLNKNNERNKKTEIENLILILWKNEKLPIIGGLLLSNNQFIGNIKSDTKKITSFKLYEKTFIIFIVI